LSVISVVIAFVAVEMLPFIVTEFKVCAKQIKTIFVFSSIIGFGICVFLFANLVNNVQMVPVSGVSHSQQFKYVNVVDVDEVKLSYLEYLEVPGFGSNKDRLRRYLEQIDIVSSYGANSGRGINP
jgi:hypothetical protein